MRPTERIAKALIDAFTGENWTDVNIQQTLQGISFEMAQRRVPFTENTIAKILYHLKYSNLLVAERATGNPAVYNNEKDGFNAPFLNSDEDWQKLIDETFLSVEILHQKIKDFNPEKLDEPIIEGFSSAYRNFQGIVEHAHYHLGQIVMIKKFLESQFQ